MTNQRVVVYRNLTIAILIPLIVAALQSLVWTNLRPYNWVLFYPAVYLCSWIGGPWTGVIATMLSAVVGGYVFNPPEFSFELRNPNAMLGTTVFVIMGLLISYVHGRWQRADRRADVLEQLRASEARFATIFHSSPNAIALSRLSDNQLLDVNSAWENMTGWSRADAIGQTALELSLWCDPAQRDQLKAQLAEHRTVHGQEIQIHARSGTILSLLMSAEIIMLQGEACLLFIALDNTDRQQAEAALRESEEQKRFLLDNTSDFIARYDRNGVMLFASGAARRFHGYEPAEIVQTSGLDRIHPEDQPLARDELQRVIETGSERRAEYRVRRENGEYMWVEAIGRRVFNTAGEPEVIVVQRDITERKQAEAALRESEQKYRDLINGMNDTVMVLDFDTTILDVNHSATTVLGYSREEFLSMHIADIDVALTPEQIHDLAGRMPVDKVQVFETRHVTKAGNKLPVEVSSSLVSYMGKTAIMSIARDITDRKLAEEKMLRSDQRLRLHSERSPLGFLELDDHFCAIEWNAACERIFGYTREEAVGHPAKDLILHPEAHELADGIYHSLMNQTGGQHSINKNITKDGRIITCEWFNTTLTDRDGKAIGVASICRDITEQVLAEHERLAHLQFMESLDQINRAIQGASNLEQMMSDVLDVVLAIFDCDRASLVYPCDPAAPSWSAPMERARPEWPGVLAQGLVVPMDPQVARIFGVSRAADGPVEFGPGYEEQLPADVAAQFNIQSQMTMALYPKIGSPWNLVMHQCSYPRAWTPQEKRLLKEIGWRIADALTSLLMFGNLHESEERFRTVADFTYDWEYWLGPAGQLIYVSPSCERITGYGAGEFQARTALLEEIIHPDDRSIFHQHLAQEFASEQVGDIDFRIVTRRGEICWINHICQSVIGSQGRWLGRRASNRDITDRKRAEAAVRQLNAELEERVAQRTHELAAANERLTELDRLKTKFVSDVSHELRTPVTSLSLYIELLEYGKPEKREQYVARLKEQMARLRQLIEEVLDLSRLEREREEGGRSPVDINVIAEHVSAMQQVAAETAGLTLTCTVVDHVPQVMARPDQLTRAITNLVSNAIKYTPRGSVHVQTSVQADRVCIEVCDTGLGIPADELPHLFERFYRGKAVAQSTVPGTGLGLAIVKEIVESHGGTVEVASTIGHGSIFRVWLPITA